MNRFSIALRDGIHATLDATKSAVNVRTLRIAVTGLSRAGKTVFLVSMISNLMAMGRGVAGTRRNTLPELAKLLEGENGEGSRLIDVEIENSGTQDFPLFDYEGLRDRLAKGANGVWPPVTDRPAMITLRLTLRRPSKLGQISGNKILRLELLDYPGEWLMDLPLLEQSYEAWSAETLAGLREEPRKKFATDFLTFLQTLQPSAPDSDKTAEHGFELYKDALLRSRQEAGLRWLQPGRFLMPGPEGEIPLMKFFPWTGAPSPVRGTLGAVLRDRFDAYKNLVRTSFFEKHFSRFTRQIVLVDILGALFAGRTAFEDTTRALRSIGESYAQQLERGWIAGRKIDSVAFAATKSDHVDDLQREHLKELLKYYVEAAKVPTRGRATYHAISAVRCTTDVDVVDTEGRKHRAVMGLPLGQTRLRPFRAGTVPAQKVPDSYWLNAYFVMPQLAPPEFPAGDAHPIEHLNLDGLLADLFRGEL
ncbi:MAG: YcjX family protein [Roseomonas sp.]|nr:YcjX family protein [Roseomonas sp.]